MDKWKKLFQQFSLKIDRINTIMGIALIVSLFWIYKSPSNRYAILSACITGGSINILNGLKQIKEPKKRTNGMTFLMMGILLIIIGFVILNMFRMNY